MCRRRKEADDDELAHRDGGLVPVHADVPHEAEAGPRGAVVLSMVSPSRAGEADEGITLLDES